MHANACGTPFVENIIFGTDPDSDVPFGARRLMSKTIDDVPIIEVMTDLVSRVESKALGIYPCDASAIVWKFGFYMHVSHGDEDSEYVFSCTGPDFFIRLYDTSGARLLPKWSIMLNFCGDLLLKSGPATNDSPMGSRKTIRGERAENGLVLLLKRHFKDQGR